MPGQRPQAWDGGVYLKKSASLDAFGRARVSNPATLFESQAQYGDSALVWETAVAGSGVVSNSLVDSSVLLSTGGTLVGASAIRQTRVHHRYQPGKSQAIEVTFVFDGGAVANARRRIGYFNANDGIFLQLDGSTLSLVRRSSTSGAPVDEVVPQTSWNMDRMDGSGPSSVSLDISKAQILFIDLQWLGVGMVRVCFNIGGRLIEVHEFAHANVLAGPYMATANLPIRAESVNTGAAGGTAVLRQICTTVYSEGGFEEAFGLQFSANRGAAVLNVAARRPVLSLRAKADGPNAVVNTGHILPREVGIQAATNGVLYELVLNGALAGAAWVAQDATNSLAEVDVTANGIVGGRVIASGMVPANGPPFAVQGSTQAGFFQKFPMVRTGLAGVQDTLSVVLTPIAAPADIHAAITWQELY